jgi:hypothetical protein
MRVNAFAPHLAGLMLPGMFDYLGIGKVERFPGDPYAHQEPWAAWFWMHTTECGSPNHVGSYKAWTIPRALRDQNTTERHPQQVLKAERPGADATDRGHAAITSPGVGPMGAGQPADAGPVAGQRELFAEAAA